MGDNGSPLQDAADCLSTTQLRVISTPDSKPFQDLAIALARQASAAEAHLLCILKYANEKAAASHAQIAVGSPHGARPGACWRPADVLAAGCRSALRQSRLRAPLGRPRLPRSWRSDFPSPDMETPRGTADPAMRWFAQGRRDAEHRRHQVLEPLG